MNGDQYLRKVSLVVQLNDKVLDLSAMRIKFRTRQSDAETPNSCAIRVYNLSDATVNQIAGTGPNTEYKTVSLSGGYQSSQFGLIFGGSIKQTRVGREDAKDTYLDIL